MAPELASMPDEDDDDGAGPMSNKAQAHSPSCDSHDLSPTSSSPKSLWSYRSSTSGSDTATATTPVVRPIAISATPSTLVPPRPFPPAFPSSFSSSPSSSSSPVGIVDGPLHELFPELCVAFSTSSSEHSSSALGLSVGNSPRQPGAEGARRLSSGMLTYFASPSRSSPLSRRVDESSPDEDEPAWARRLPPPFGIPSSPSSPPHAFNPSRLSSNRRRRRSSLSYLSNSSSSAGAVPPFGSFVGSFEHSLLSGHMSALPSIPLPFIASIGVLGSPDTPLRLRCPAHLHVPFTAVFYSPPGEISAASPYVGTVDLEAHYLSLLDVAPTDSAASIKLPRFPGYQIPVRGQLQLVLKNGQQTAFKPFLIPYDLTDLERDGKGGRTFLRQKSYAVGEDRVQGPLRFAVHLQFCSPPAAKAKKGAPPPEPKFYLYHAIRVVFASRGLDSTDKFRVVLEGPEELVGGAGPREERFGAYAGPGQDWETARKKAKAREKARLASATKGGEQDATATTTLTTGNNAPPAPIPIAFSVAPYVPTIASAVPVPAALSPTLATPEPLTFERIPSPLPAAFPRPPFLADARTRKPSHPSGLAASRPSSRDARSREGSGSRERCGR
ncbi:hypothetical protein JCM10213_000851 [Rhodosporidiobolus nylandii]